MNNHYVYNPASFNPLRYLPDRLAKFAEAARYFIHLIYVRRIYDKRYKSDFIELKAAYLKRMLSDDYYRDIIDALLDGGIIEMDRSYVPGRKSQGYRLCERLREEQHCRVPITSKVMINRIEKVKEKDAVKIRKVEVHRHLHEHLRSVEIDAEQAMGLLPAEAMKVEAIREGDFFFKICPYGRVHTNLTSLNTPLRQFLTVGGDRLVNLDIVNSQPLFLGLVVLDYYKNGGHLSSSYNHSFSSLLSCSNLDTGGNVPEELYLPSLSSPTPVHMIRVFDRLPQDVLEYLEQVQKGLLYDNLVVKLGLPEEFRGDVKEELFRTVFFGRDTARSPVKTLFGLEYPSVMAVIKHLKREDYRFLARYLQRVESSFVVHRVVRRLMRMAPEIFLGTIHDSLLCRERHATVVLSVLEEEFKALGLMPAIRSEGPAFGRGEGTDFCRPATGSNSGCNVQPEVTPCSLAM